ncbi:MAG: NfeD family protein [Roseburia sp.]
MDQIMIFIWIALIIVFLVIEIATVGLTTIWFAGGSLIALLAGIIGAPLWLQIVLFFAVSVLLLIFTRPWALKYITPHKIKTNYEDAIGKKVKVTARIDNAAGTGTVILNGQEWTARSEQDDVTFEVESMPEVVKVSGVKLIVR